MHAGVIASSQTAAWLGDLEPGVVLPLVAGAAIYAAGVRALWRRGVGRGVGTREVLYFALGWVILFAALGPPLDEWSDELFSAHMVQHELMMTVAAPLLLLGRPAFVMLWAFPGGARRRIGTVLRMRAVRGATALVMRPFDAWLIHGAAIWIWHIPSLFQATLTSPVMHALQHLSFFGSALVFWWAVMHPARRAALGFSLVLLFTTAVHTAVLGALMTFARAPWYPAYASGAASWGLTPLADQQLAGLIMWIPASLAYLVAALVIVSRWLRESEGSVVRRERAAIRILTVTGSNVS